MNNVESNLRIKNVYFSELSFKRDETIGNKIELNNTFDVKYEDISTNEEKVSIIYEGFSNESLFSIKAIINGVFELTNYEDLDEETAKSLLKINTIAILFPYLRSQVVLLTSQLGLNPIQLPIINAELLYNSTLRK